MKYAIVYSSLTGNTALLAKTLQQSLPAEDCVYFGTPAENVEAPLILAGFWTDKGDCDQKSAAFLEGLRNTQIFLFGTAGFGGSQAYYHTILQRVQGHLDASVKVVGAFLCQGKMGDGVRQRLECQLAKAPEDAKTKAMLENFEQAKTHPDQADLDALLQAVREVM